MIKPLNIEALRAALAYDAQTGVLMWRCRGDRSPQWNGHYAGKEAGTVASHGYKMVWFNGRNITAHRIILALADGLQPEFIDHIDGDKLNNARANLRSATREQNGFNQKKHADGAARFKCVSWSKGARKWEAYIRLDGRKKHLGFYEDDGVAARVYDEAARKHYGEYARPNFI